MVTLHIDEETGHRIAVKHIFVGDSRDTLIGEVDSLAKLHHPCVIRIFGWSDGQHSTWGEIHMEFAPNRSLEDLLERARTGIPTVLQNPTAKAKLICGIVLGMRYVHSQGILHRDIKPANILLDEKWRPKISDFGVSRPESADGPPTADTGTVWYAAPEQLEENMPHTRKTDVFSFGYVLYEILTGKEVFAPSERAYSVLKRIRAQQFPTLPEAFGSLMQGLVRRCWSNNPRDRPSFEAIFREFEDCGFAILPDADPERIQACVNEILALERAPKQQPA
jgi:serine/threonine protein kinase